MDKTGNKHKSETSLLMRINKEVMEHREQCEKVLERAQLDEED